MRVLVVVMAPFDAAVPFGGFSGLLRWSLTHVQKRQPSLFPSSLTNHQDLVKFEEIKPCLAKDDFAKAKAMMPPKEAIIKNDIDAIILSGGLSMVSDCEPWSECCAEWIRQEAIPSERPILGICYGHQLLAHALGGKVGYCPNGKQIGIRKAKWHSLDPDVQSDPICSPLAAVMTMKTNLLNKNTSSTTTSDDADKNSTNPTKKGNDVVDPLDVAEQQEFDVLSLHHQSIVELPKGAKIFASSDQEPHQVVKFQENVYSTQFHGEYSTDFVRQRFDDDFAKKLEMIDEHVEKYEGGKHDTSHSSAIIARFLDYALQRKNTRKDSNLQD